MTAPPGIAGRGTDLFAEGAMVRHWSLQANGAVRSTSGRYNLNLMSLNREGEMAFIETLVPRRADRREVETLVPRRADRRVGERRSTIERRLGERRSLERAHVGRRVIFATDRRMAGRRMGELRAL
jgi:hypothetical protein